MRFPLFAILLLPAATLAAQDIISTEAYRWQGDTIFQGEYKAWSDDGRQLHSTYSAQPGYYMPIEKYWTVRNDISTYPQLSTPNRLHTAIYNLGLDEMVNAVEPDTTLRTGKEWAGVWTRDVSYSILLSMAYMQPEATRVSLMRKVSPTGRIIQDTGSGGAWPVSSDRMIWALAAYELYKVTGDREWLEYIYPVILNSMEDDLHVTRSASGLVKGETSFIDWREQSYPRWMQTADIYASEALGTSVVHAQAMRVLSEIAAELGHDDVARKYAALADETAEAINSRLWLDDKGYYAMYNYGRVNPVVNPRAETLGESLAVLYGIADENRTRSIAENTPVTPFGVGIFFPQIADQRPYHNDALWPWVGAYWALANAKARNEAGTLEAIGAVFRPAALFTTNKENFVLDNGDIATELNSSNMLWCLAGNIAITHKILFGLRFEKDGLAIEPFVPRALGQTRTLSDFRYRGATLDITVKGFGDRIASCTVNGRRHEPFIPADIKPGKYEVVITMADNDIAPMRVNRTPNVKAPLTPVATLTHSDDADAPGAPVNNLLQWHPIEYINHYLVLRDGAVVDTTRQTSYPAIVPGEYQVIGVSDDGVQSFASEPLCNYEAAAWEFPGEGTAMASEEISYPAERPVNGWHGAGFVETDHRNPSRSLEFDVPADGTYAITVVYANGNGPVNTENKCAVRTLEIDGSAAGTAVMPQRGRANWDDWGRSNVVTAPLKAGRHKLSLTLRPENENMNLHTNHALLDRVIVQRIR